MATLIFLLLALFFLSAKAHVQFQEDGFISVMISENGLVFAKDLLIQQALLTLTPLHLRNIQKSVKIPFVGGVEFALSNITLSQINVSSSYITPGDMGVTIVASGATANLTMNWCYSYSTWLIPVDISDKGRASIQVEGMQVGLTLRIENQGALELTLVECGTSLKDISITLDGGASWFYQGLVDAFKGQIRSSVETTVTRKIKEGILKLDSLLRDLPKEIPVDDIAALNVTFVNDPLVGDSSVSFEINGLFTALDTSAAPNSFHEDSEPTISSKDPLKMIGISIDEAVFNSASVTYFDAQLMNWIVDKIPDQSLLNTAGWRYIVPQLYKKYPKDDMKLNVSLTSPPTIRTASDGFDATIFMDVTIDVLDANETIPVACISTVISASGTLEIFGNNLAGEAELDDFSLKLKWSKVGNFHMHLIQVAMRLLLKDVFLPYVNVHLRKGFPLPIIHGFTLRNADILFFDSRIVVSSDVVFTDSYAFQQLGQ